MDINITTVTSRSNPIAVVTPTRPFSPIIRKSISIRSIQKHTDIYLHLYIFMCCVFGMMTITPVFVSLSTHLHLSFMNDAQIRKYRSRWIHRSTETNPNAISNTSSSSKGKSPPKRKTCVCARLPRFQPKSPKNWYLTLMDGFCLAIFSLCWLIYFFL